jgi:hypothetical protein
MDTNTLYKVHVSPVTHFYAVLEPSNTTGWYKYYTQKRARAAHPNLTATETLSETDFLVQLHRRATPVVLNEQPAAVSDEEGDEELYLVGGCGEAFDDIRIAYEHLQAGCKDCAEAGTSFYICTEEEAF